MIGWIVETSNDDFARHISIHELERLLMCDPYSEIFEGFMNVSCFDLHLIES